MRVGMFINYYIPSKGGMETSVINLSKGLREAGHEVFIFAPNYPNWKETDKNTFRYKTFSFTCQDYLYVLPVPFISNMGEVVKSLNLDIIHSHQPMSLGDEALKFGKKLGIPVAFTYHIKYEDYYHYILFTPKKLALAVTDFVVKRYCRKCDAIIAPSSSIKNLLFRAGIKKSVYVIPSGISIDEFSKDQGRRQEIRDKFGIKEGELLLVTASRLAPEKNIEFLIRSFAIISKRAENVKFMIIGGGPHEDELKALVKEMGLEDKIIFAGFLEKSDMVAHYQAGDIFMFASLTETQGLVLVEAMAAGLPVVAVKADGVEDMVKSGNDGILTDNKEENFAENALKLIEGEDLRKKMAENAKVNCQEFSIKPWVNKVVNLYQELMEKKKG